MGDYKYKQKNLKIRYTTYLALRRKFPGIRGETMNDYILRLAKELIK